MTACCDGRGGIFDIREAQEGKIRYDNVDERTFGLLHDGEHFQYIDLASSATLLPEVFPY